MTRSNAVKMAFVILILLRNCLDSERHLAGSQLVRGRDESRIPSAGNIYLGYRQPVGRHENLTLPLTNAKNSGLKAVNACK